jgi:hypothetical protein
MTRRIPCAYAAAHHSPDRVTVHHGTPVPTVLCGYHASPGWLPTVLATLATLPRAN